MRSVVAAATVPLRDVAGAVEEHVLWRLADLVRAVFEIVRWPFERLAWTVERRLVWPLQERAAGAAPAVPSRAIPVGALAAVACGVVAIGVVALSGSGDDPDRVASGATVAATAPAPPPEDEPSGPVLQGVPPKFGVADGVGVAAAEGPPTGAQDDAPAADPIAEAEDSTAAVAEEEGATTSSQKPVPAGPAAMKVARRFSEAFVFYEIGRKPARALAVFEQTATPQLATALAERPPRQPANTEVPKARVLNLVPGPRRGGAYTVSASLLRVGVTSELRLEMAKRAGTWLVTDVRG